ncbi:hypothetical protein ACWGII_30690 [Streptomyces sp. NPDC054855]
MSTPAPERTTRSSGPGMGPCAFSGATTRKYGDSGNPLCPTCLAKAEAKQKKKQFCWWGRGPDLPQ